MNNYIIYLLCNFVTFCYTSHSLFNYNLNKEQQVLRSIHKNLDEDCVLYAANLDYVLEANELLRPSWKKMLYIEYVPLQEPNTLTRFGHVVLVWKHPNYNTIFVSDENGTVTLNTNSIAAMDVAKKVFGAAIIFKASYVD